MLKIENGYNLNLHRPSRLKEALNFLRLRQIKPSDLGDPASIIKLFPDLGGDPELGIGNDGGCPSWCGDWDWHKKFLKKGTS